MSLFLKIGLDPTREMLIMVCTPKLKGRRVLLGSSVTVSNRDCIANFLGEQIQSRFFLAVFLHLVNGFVFIFLVRVGVDLCR